MAFKCSSPPCWIFIDILMLTRHLVQMTEEALVAMASSLVRIQCPGLPTNKRLCLATVQNLSIVLLRLLLRRLLIWIQSILQEICLSFSSPPLLWCDNKSAAHLAANPVFHARTKHIEMDLYFIRDHVLRKQLIIQYIPSSEQVANIFTKHISSSQFFSFRTKLYVVPSHVSLQGDDRQYLADQQEEDSSRRKVTVRDQLQQTKVF